MYRIAWGVQRADVVEQGVASAGSAGKTTGSNDGGAALANRWQEGFLQPFGVGDDFGDWLAADGRMEVVCKHRWAVVAVDDDVFDIGHWHAGFLRQLRGGAVLIETGHRGPAISGDTFALVGADHAVGVAWVADHGNPGVIGGDSIDGLALTDEDFAVVFQEIGSFHAWAAWF